MLRTFYIYIGLTLSIIYMDYIYVYISIWTLHMNVNGWLTSLVKEATEVDVVCNSEYLGHFMQDQQGQIVPESRRPVHDPWRIRIRIPMTWPVVEHPDWYVRN